MQELKIIIVSGLPCSGKSTLAEGVSKELKIPIFSVDPIESSILKTGIKKSFETGYAAYLISETLAGEQLKQGISVIIDAISPVIESRDMWKRLSETYKAKLIIIECKLEEDLHRERVRLRVRNIHGIPEVTWENIEEIKRYYLEWNEERLILDSSNSSIKNTKTAIDYILNK